MGEYGKCRSGFVRWQAGGLALGEGGRGLTLWKKRTTLLSEGVEGYIHKIGCKTIIKGILE